MYCTIRATILIECIYIIYRCKIYTTYIYILIYRPYATSLLTAEGWVTIAIVFLCSRSKGGTQTTPEKSWDSFPWSKNCSCTLQGTNISPKNGILKMIFLFPRWDMLVPWRVCVLRCLGFVCYRLLLFFFWLLKIQWGFVILCVFYGSCLTNSIL